MGGRGPPPPPPSGRAQTVRQIRVADHPQHVRREPRRVVGQQRVHAVGHVEAFCAGSRAHDRDPVGEGLDDLQSGPSGEAERDQHDVGGGQLGGDPVVRDLPDQLDAGPTGQVRHPLGLASEEADHRVRVAVS